MNIPKIMVFRPTVEEFSDFSRYIQYMESQGAHFAGVAKVIPPKEWIPRKSYDNIDNVVIPAPIEQVVSGQKGLYTQYNIQRKPVTVKEFRRLTNTRRYEPPFHESYDELERIYWKNITFNSAIYGADISGSLYDQDVDIWNVARLNTLLDVIEDDSGVKIEGVNTAYLYFGMWKTTFAWHTEDMDLYSINYVHFGAPKSWYAIPPEHGKRFERLAAGFYPNCKTNCSAFLRHKMTLISPSVLRQYGIPVNKITQEAGEFMITFPYGYHAGFNHGFNCAESTNFASERWVDYGKAAEKCTCRNDTVTIDMDIFVQFFQPDQYENWKTVKQEGKLTYTELPAEPDMKAPFPTWKERVERFKQLYDISALLKKLSKSSSRKSTKIRSPKSPSKSPQKVKKYRERQSSASPVKLSSAVKKLAGDPDKLTSTNSVSTESLQPCCSSTVILPGTSQASLLKHHLNDHSASSSRRKSSAKAISCADEMILTSPTIVTSPKKPGKYPKIDCDLNRASCTVQCETISSLPYTVVSKQPFVVKEPPHPVTSGLKRRHPVSKKSNKKICTNILVKYGRHNVSESSIPSSEKKPTEAVPCKLVGRATFKDELNYNENMAKLSPHCAICSLFKPCYSTPQENISTEYGLPSSIPQAAGKPQYVAGNRTKPIIPEVSFASNADMPSPLAECKLLDKHGKSPLVQCCVCKLQVHASCYGIKNPPEDASKPWTCDRCMERSWSAQCCLCCMRGGALKQVSGRNDWAHVVCAVAIPEVYFEDTAHRNGINLSRLPSKRSKLKCVYGKSTIERGGVCLQCCSGRCAVAFHTTCAHAAGIPIEPGNWPFQVYAHCYKHSMIRMRGTEQDNQRPLKAGTGVVARHKNGNYYPAVVRKLKRQDFYKVNFLKDNSWSDNLYAQDIVSHDWSSGLSPVVGSVVEVKWTDGLLYEAEYRGHSLQESHQVEFDDGLLVDFERNEIFTEDDPIPPKIRRKIRIRPLKPVGSD